MLHGSASEFAQHREFVECDRGEFSIGTSQHENIAKNFVIVVTTMVQSVTASLRANNFAGSHRFPATKSNFDFVFQLDLIAGLQVFKNMKCLQVLFIHGARYTSLASIHDISRRNARPTCSISRF